MKKPKKPKPKYLTTHSAGIPILGTIINILEKDKGLTVQFRPTAYWDLFQEEIESNIKKSKS